jgi:caa(3)-type oxidase subunit IV
MTALRPSIRRFAVCWLGLLAGLAVELAATKLLPGRFGRPVLLLAMAAMVAAVMLVFMRLRKASGLSQAFAVGGLLWLAILLGLGSMDPLTRTDTPTPAPPATSAAAPTH